MGELHLDIVKIESIEITISSEKGQVPYRQTIVCKCVEEYVHKKQTGGAGRFVKAIC